MANKKRIKSDTEIIPIENWDKADGHIRRIGDLIQQIQKAEADAKESIDKIKAVLAEDVKPSQKEIKKLTRSIEAFAANHREDFGSARSRKLNFGLLGWRKSTSISIKKDITLELIKQVFSRAKAKTFIRITESVNKETLANLKDEQLATVKAQRKVKDDFFVEPSIPEAAKL